MPETIKMCRMCHLKSPYNNSCNMSGVNINVQNKRAEVGECRDARISGPDRQDTYQEIHGWMKRQKDGQWMFKGVSPYCRFEMDK